MSTAPDGGPVTDADYLALAARLGVDPALLDPWVAGPDTVRATQKRLWMAWRSGELPAEKAAPVAAPAPQSAPLAAAPAPTTLHAVPAPSEPVSGSATPPARAYAEQYVALPRDLVTVFKKRHGGGVGARLNPEPNPDANGRDRVLAGHAAGRFRLRHLDLLAALYRLASQTGKKEWRVYVSEEVLAAASGWAPRSLRRAFYDGHPLAEWVDLTEYRRGHYDLTVKAIRSDRFIKVPAWWLWAKPDPNAHPDDRFQRRHPAGHKGLLAALALSHVMDYDTQTADRYGATGLATVAGVDLSTMKRALRAAEKGGMLAVTNRGGGGACARYQVLWVPADAAEGLDQAQDIPW